MVAIERVEGVIKVGPRASGGTAVERRAAFERFTQSRLERAYRLAKAGTPEAAGTFYAINLAALAEQNRIRGDTNLTSGQKSIELKRLELEQLQANTVAKGGELPPEPTPPPTPAQRIPDSSTAPTAH